MAKTIKAAFFDFDDTLFIHNHLIEERVKYGRLEDFTELWKGRRKVDLTPATEVINFAKLLKENGTKIYVLSYDHISLAQSWKKDVVEKNIPGLFDDVIIVSSPDMKITTMDAYSLAEGIGHSDILLIDDAIGTLFESIKNGFIAISPQEIMVNGCEKMYEKIQNINKDDIDFF